MKGRGGEEVSVVGGACVREDVCLPWIKAAPRP